MEPRQISFCKLWPFIVKKKVFDANEGLLFLFITQPLLKVALLFASLLAFCFRLAYLSFSFLKFGASANMFRAEIFASWIYVGGGDGWGRKNHLIRRRCAHRLAGAARPSSSKHTHALPLILLHSFLDNVRRVFFSVGLFHGVFPGLSQAALTSLFTSKWPPF